MTARELAFDLLLKAEASKQYSNIALDNALQKSDLSTADKNLVSALFYGACLLHRLVFSLQDPLGRPRASARYADRLEALFRDSASRRSDRGGAGA